MAIRDTLTLSGVVSVMLVKSLGVLAAFSVRDTAKSVFDTYTKPPSEPITKEDKRRIKFEVIWMLLVLIVGSAAILHFARNGVRSDSI